MIKNKNIVLVSNEPWGEVWYSKHNYANELSKNNAVLFINPVSGWFFLNLFKFKVNYTTVTNHLTVLSYNNILPIRNKFLYTLNNLLVSRLLKKEIYRKTGGIDIFWSFDPFRLSNPNLFGAETSIFHSVDKYNFVPYGEKELAIKSKFVIGVSEVISGIYKSLNKNVFTIPHGISEDEFKFDEEKIKSIPYNNYFLYVGNIDFRLDWELIKKLVSSFVNVSFLFIGKINKNLEVEHKMLFEANQYPNLIYINALPFKELRNYIYKSTLCLAPMSSAVNGNAIAHHKIYQYLAQGKPVLGIEFSDYIPFKELLYMSNDSTRLISMAKEFLKNGEDPDLPGKRIALAEKNKFEILLTRISETIYGE
jgi:hypothetical protein